ncbi:hypothetical protein PS914_05949 [Pseudomonas fluorescens]|uniref:hypothetical protein n=1 Tax=Pseudomonas fluorescens TaxID=294 RepID=UPI0012408122|nr:hypothetical protein [Pseudomonas fluorescens]VVQ17034.1 hypothetical protein PS914_05949 [Pseudomonas fluorescens]
MARATHANPESSPAADVGSAADTVQETALISAPADDQISTNFLPVVDSLTLTLPAADADKQIVIYPVRSYLDGKEIRQAGGVGYASPKHEALLLIAKGLATDQKPGA